MDSLHDELNHINCTFLKATAFKHAAYDFFKRDLRLNSYRNLRRLE